MARGQRQRRLRRRGRLAHESLKFAPSQRRPIRYIFSMSTVQDIQAAILKRSPQEQAELREWLEDYFEDRLS